MPTYIAIGTHSPSQCPGANSQMGELFQRLMADAPAIGSRHSVRLADIQHLGPSHQLLYTFEADSADALNEYLLQSRLAEVQDVKVYFATDLHAFMTKVQQLNLQPLYERYLLEGDSKMRLP